MWHKDNGGARDKMLLNGTAGVRWGGAMDGVGIAAELKTETAMFGTVCNEGLASYSPIPSIDLLEPSPCCLWFRYRNRFMQVTKTITRTHSQGVGNNP